MMRRKADRDRVQRPAKQRIWAGCHARFCPWSFSAKARAAPSLPLATEAGAEPGNGMGGPWWGRATLCAVSFASLIGTAVFQKVPASTASCLIFSKKKQLGSKYIISVTISLQMSTHVNRVMVYISIFGFWKVFVARAYIVNC